MNPKQRKQMIIMAVLGVALVVVVIGQLRAGGAKKPPAAGKTAAATAGAADRARPTSSAKADEKVTIKKADVDVHALIKSVETLQFSYNDFRIPRDPMKPLVGAESGPVEWPGRESQGESLIQNEIYINAIREKIVSGIVWDETNPCAVVDNEVVFKGSQLPLGKTGTAAITVVDIGVDYVLFRGGQVELPVRLKE